MENSTLGLNTESADNGAKSTERNLASDGSLTGSTTPLTDLVSQIEARLRKLVRVGGTAQLEVEKNGGSNETPVYPLTPTMKVFSLETHHPKVEILSKKMVGFAQCCIRNDRQYGTWFVLAGQTGCGKTHCAEKLRAWYNAVKIEAWHRGWFGGQANVSPACWVDWPSCGSPRRANLDRFDELLADVMGARLVILDDIGAECDSFKSGEPAMRLTELLNACRDKWLLVTTNIEPEKWDEHFDQRVADRLHQARFMVMFDVPSYRMK